MGSEMCIRDRTCSLQCSICQRSLERSSLTEKEFKERFTRRLVCETCWCPPCMVEGCRTCQQCHNPKCKKMSGCKKPRHRLNPKAVPTLEEQTYFRCDACKQCRGRGCGQTMHWRLAVEWRQQKKREPWYCSLCDKKKMHLFLLGFASRLAFATLCMTGFCYALQQG